MRVFGNRSGARHRRTRAVVGALVGAVLIVSGCTGGDSDRRSSENREVPTGTDREIETITWAVRSQIASLDQAFGYDANTQSANETMLEPLVAIGPDLDYVPVLAEKWEETSPTEIVFTLRDGVTFWNGDPVTADDVVFSISRLSDPALAAPAASLYSNISAVEATSDSEVRVTLLKPQPDIYSYIAGVGIISRTYAKAAGRELGTSQKLTMGTGAYKPVEFSPSVGATVQRNEDYWGEKPTVKEIKFKVITDPQSLAMAVRSGDVQGTIGVPTNDLATWESFEQIELLFAPTGNIDYLMVNTVKGPLSDIHARRALAHVVDRAGIVNAVYQTQAEPAKSVVSPALWGTLESEDETNEFYEDLPQLAFDQAAAEEELAKSATPDGFALDVVVPSDSNANYTAIMEIVKQAAAKIGIDITLVRETRASWLASVQRGVENDPLGIFGFGATSLNPMAVPLSVLSHESNDSKFSAFDSPEVADLLAQFNAGSAKADRVAPARALTELLGEELPFIPIAHGDLSMALDKELVFASQLTGFIQFSGYNWAMHLRAAK